HELPLRPTPQQIRQTKNHTRPIYPESPNTATNEKRMALCDTKITTPPRPATIPLTSRSVSTPGGMTEISHPLKEAKPSSISDIGYSASEKLDWKMMKSINTKISRPNTLCVNTLSILLVTVSAAGGTSWWTQSLSSSSM